MRFFDSVALEAPGDDELAQLAPGRPRGREVEVLGELLGDRRAADLQLALLPVLLEGAAHRVPVHAVVLPEARVLGGDDGALQLGRDPRERHRRPLEPRALALACASSALRRSMKAVVEGHGLRERAHVGQRRPKQEPAAPRAAARRDEEDRAGSSETRHRRRHSLADGDRPAQLPDALVRLVLRQHRGAAGSGRRWRRRRGPIMPVLEAGGERPVAHLLVGQVEGDEEAAAAHVRHDAGELRRPARAGAPAGARRRRARSR